MSENKLTPQHVKRAAVRRVNNAKLNFPKKVFTFWQKHGWHVVPNHYYWPIPDTRELVDEVWTKPSELPGVDMNVAGQLELLESFRNEFAAEYDALPREGDPQREFFLNNMSYETVDAESLYCFIRHYKPRRMIEIGSGHSTKVAALAFRKNREEGHEAHFTAIEPYPQPWVTEGLDGLDRVLVQSVQDVPLAEFQALGENDILLIDSSHVLAIGSDVQYEFLEVVPRLGKGVLVHVHDIFFPYEMPKEWVKDEHRFWTEQYLLQAFLAFNAAFAVRFAGYYLHREHPEALEQAFQSYREKQPEQRPQSFWMQKTS